MVGGRPPRLDPASQRAIAALLENPVRELLPLRWSEAAAAALAPGDEVSVTASPTKPIEVTVELAVRLHGHGLHAIPHLSARMIRDRGHLAGLLARIVDAGIDEVFVVGGDENAVGAYTDGLGLLRAIAESRVAFRHIGIPCYPDGHAFIPEDRLLESLHAKAPLATYMTTQLCFDARTIDAWIRARRRDGLALPVVLGLAGAVEPHRLLAISARIGVRDTRRFLAKNLGLVARLLRSGGFYRPDGLLAGLAPTVADPSLGVSGIHLFTFNQVAATEAWRRDFLARLGAVPAPVGATRAAGAGANDPGSDLVG